MKMGRFLRLVDKLSALGLPTTFGKHYIRPHMERRPQKPCNPKRYFESLYRATRDQEFSDGLSIRPRHNPVYVKHHYNVLENLILEYLAEQEITEVDSILDIGSGPGHWVDFSLSLFPLAQVAAVEISETAARKLSRRYLDDARVKVHRSDIANPSFSLSRGFDIIFAIGVMYHIVDDNQWQTALDTLKRHLRAGGRLIVSGQFGRTTSNVQFHDTDTFDSIDELRNSTGTVALVDKRIRSLKHWRTCARRVGLEITDIRRAKRHRHIEAPENNLMVLQRRE